MITARQLGLVSEARSAAFGGNDRPGTGLANAGAKQPGDEPTSHWNYRASSSEMGKRSGVRFARCTMKMTSRPLTRQWELTYLGRPTKIRRCSLHGCRRRSLGPCFGQTIFVTQRRLQERSKMGD